MMGCPFPISREYSDDLPERIRLSRGDGVRPDCDALAESDGRAARRAAATLATMRRAVIHFLRFACGGRFSSRTEQPVQRRAAHAQDFRRTHLIPAEIFDDPAGVKA